MFFCDGVLLCCVCLWSFARACLYCSLLFFLARLVRAASINFFVFFFLAAISRKKKLSVPQNSFEFVIRKAHAAILSITTETTKMPSEEQQLPEPLLDDGGNDRFVLFPLKYDAVWEMVRRRRRLLRKKNIFEKSSAF